MPRTRCRLDPWVRRFPGGGHGSPLQCSDLEIPWTDEPGGLQPMGLPSRTGLSTQPLRRAGSLHFSLKGQVRSRLKSMSPGSLGSLGPGYLTPPAVSHLHHLSPLASSPGKNKDQKRESWRSLLPEGFKDAGCREWGNPEKSTSAQPTAHSQGAEAQTGLRTRRPPGIGQSRGHGPQATRHGPEPRTRWGVAPGPSLHHPPVGCLPPPHRPGRAAEKHRVSSASASRAGF